MVAAVGPAGSGKTTAMRAACHAWEAAGRRVIPLATSAKSAEVLGAELGRRAENVHKFLHELQRPIPTDAWYTLRRGDVLLVDEAGMAGTLRLNELLGHARRAGAQVRLLGDPWQLGAVEAGGALRLITHDVGAIELADLHRSPTTKKPRQHCNFARVTPVRWPSSDKRPDPQRNTRGDARRRLHELAG